jgi:acetyl-CoA carboxylase biotin carboxyl carrier protein
VQRGPNAAANDSTPQPALQIANRAVEAPPLPATSAPFIQHPTVAPEAPAAEPVKLHIVPSPIVGTYYRAASPTAEPFVKVGDEIGAGQTLCIIEAMKLMNEISSDVNGKISKIYVENGQPVEYGQPLFGIQI